MLPFVYKRTELHLAGHSQVEVIAAIKAALDKKELPTLEPGAVSYMMSKSSYLSDVHHNAPHLMFYEPVRDDATWGANMPNSPVVSVNYWYLSAQVSTAQELSSHTRVRGRSEPVLPNLTKRSRASIYALSGRQGIASAGFVSIRPATIFAPFRLPFGTPQN